MWTTIITNILSLLLTGGLVTVICLREIKKSKQLENDGKQIENKDKESEIYLKLINELQDQIENLNTRCDKKDERITELEDANSDLHNELDKRNTELAKATLLRCTRIGCDKRKPPLGYLELTPEELIAERNESNI